MEQELAQFQNVYQLITEFLVNYSFQIVGAIIILAVGIVVARKCAMLVERQLLKHKVDVTLSRFAAAGVKILLIAMIAIIALGKVGISVTPFVAAVGALSLGVGLALQGMLANFGAGVCIIVTRPFVVGDTISVQGVTGVVKSVQLGNTILSNEDEVQIMIPNKHIVGEIIHNSYGDSIIESGITVGYHSDSEQVIALIQQALKSVSGLNNKRLPQVGVEAFTEQGLRIGFRCWVRTTTFFQSKCQAHAAILQLLKSNGIEIRVPQHEVKLIGQAIAKELQY